MNKNALQFDWNRLKVFFAVAEEGSYSAAGRVLQMSQPTVGRHVAALEEELSVALFERVGRGMQLTPTGLDLIEHARAMGEAASRVSLIAEGQSLSLDGELTITAGEAISVFVLPPVLRRIREQYPGIAIEVVASNNPSDLLQREADIALRNFQPTEPDLVAKKISDSCARLYATPEYLERIGNPTTVDGLSVADFVGFDRTDTYMKGLNAMGLSLTMDNFPIVTGNQLMQWELVKQGAGLGIMMEDIGDAEPAVVRVETDMMPFPVPMWLATHRELQTSRRVRVVFDILVKELSA